MLNNSDIIEKLSTMSEASCLASSDDGRFFYELSPDRINVIEWIPVPEEGNVLLIGGQISAFAGIAEKAASLSVVVKEPQDADLIRARFPGLCENGKIRFLTELPQEEFLVVIDTCFDGTVHKENLSEGGIYAIVAENSDSLLLSTGTGRSLESTYMSYGDLLRLEKTEDCGKVRCYYPLPGMAFARDIKGGALLPAPGDFRGVSESYTEERVACCDDEALFDSISRTSPELLRRFVPSYLVLLGGEELPDHIRYNRKRKEEYRIKTELYKDQKCVKTALTEKADSHIASFPEKYELLVRTGNGRIRVLCPRICTSPGKRTSAVFPYVKGKSAGKTLAEKIENGRVSGEFTDFVSLLTEGECHNLDILLDNVMLSEEGPVLIDYEWVTEEALDPGFVRYRICRYFYEDNRESLTGYRDLSDFLVQTGTPAEKIPLYDEKEDDFQLSVHGSDKGSYENRFRKEALSASRIREMRRSLEAGEDRIHRLSDEVEELKTALSKEREVERLSQQHIRNIENINKVREAQIEAQNAELTDLRAHQSLPSRIRRKIIARVDAFAPAGSKKRLAIKYVKGTLRHPAVYLKRYLTKEGRNFMRGDFSIRGEFSEGGILTLPEEQHPLVSIVIPAYNQVQYTYACIRSILLNTDPELTPYEVILADDASTDATREIKNWIRNLTVAETGGNLGFLRNCNNAAKNARGSYIFFLNNDTKVTENWLSSLVKRMEEDKSIGMAGSKLIYPDGRLQEAGGIIWSDASGWNYGRLSDPKKPEYCYVKEVDYISGAAIMIRKELWEEIGGFDERFAPAYCEDSDLAFEVRRHGKKVVFEPDSVVVHFEGVSNGTDVNGTGLKRYQVVNQQKFREKWAEELREQSENNGNPNPFAARDRSQKKKTILVIDHYVPQRDKDAGSKTTFQYLRMFVEKGYNVKFLPDNFLHEEPYSHELEEMGIEILYGDEMRESIYDWIVKNKDFIDFAYLNRPHIAVRYIDFLKENTAIKCIFYGHDLHYLRIRREYELTGDIRKRRESDYWRSVEYQVMEKADMVYYPSQDEIDEIRSRRPEIRAKAITAYIYDKEEAGKAQEAGYEKREGLLFVGGFRHPPNEDGVLWFIEEIWPEIHRRLPEVKFYITGSHPTEKILSEDGKNNVQVLGFVSDERLAELYHTTRLTVVPLRYGAGVKGKVIEALNEDSCIVTTPVGAEGIPSAKEVMSITESAEGFAESVVKLYQDPGTLASMSAACAPFIGKYYSTEAVWEIVKEDFT